MNGEYKSRDRTTYRSHNSTLNYYLSVISKNIQFIRYLAPLLFQRH